MCYRSRAVFKMEEKNQKRTDLTQNKSLRNIDISSVSRLAIITKIWYNLDMILVTVLGFKRFSKMYIVGKYYNITILELR